MNLIRLLKYGLPIVCLLLCPGAISQTYAETRSYEQQTSKSLTTCRDLLVEERIRWYHLHTGDKQDTCVVVPTDTGLKIDISIDSPVKNIINNQPITRTYLVTDTALSRRSSNSIYFNALHIDISLLAAASLHGGIRPAASAGIRLKSFPRFGVSAYTAVFTNGLSLYYMHQQGLFAGTCVHLLLGTDFDGKLSPGIGIGYVF